MTAINTNASVDASRRDRLTDDTAAFPWACQLTARPINCGVVISFRLLLGGAQRHKAQGLVGRTNRLPVERQLVDFYHIDVQFAPRDTVCFPTGN